MSSRDWHAEFMATEANTHAMTMLASDAIGRIEELESMLRSLGVPEKALANNDALRKEMQL